MERVIAIDVGEKRIGVAVSDALGITAQPLAVVERDGRGAEWKRLASLVEEIKPARAVVGLPLKMDGSECPATVAARQFAKTFSSKHPNVEILFQDERLTTAASERLLIEAGMRRENRRQKRDIISATLILETWLASHANALK